jgi:hypothetical protein
MSAFKGSIVAIGIELTATAVIFLSCQLAGCQETVYDFASSNFPSAAIRPHKPILSKTELALLAGAAVARGLDVYSTRRALSCECNREMELPGFVADHAWTMSLYSASEVGLQYWMARKLSVKHPRLAKAVTLFDLATTSASVGHNLSLHIAPRGVTLRRIVK